ncbi:MAG: type I DNA topoisomerase [Rickettsiales bacterium]|jgi:DNA topoisomerase-1|nr:type I DNA topoisomerase [Rickettsiales bacterium]
MRSLVVVESPAKAKTINKYLGKDYRVMASMGHIRELPSKDGSVDTESFELKYEISKRSSKIVSELSTAMKDCGRLILATDPDREGEAIAWHVLEVLRQKKAIKNDTPVERVVFSAITENTVKQAIKEPRSLDQDLVSAQQARRALDYLFGFTLSPVLWRKLPGSRSAGRVQSVALRLICERHEEILNFKPEEYWSIDALLINEKGKELTAKLVEFNGKKIDRLGIKNKETVNKILENISKEKFTVSKVEKKEVKRLPYAPFTTSTLQQEAVKKLGFNTKKTMNVAQKLYEGIDIGSGAQGLITYMRTDGVYTAPEAVKEAREVIEKNYGVKYLPSKSIIYENKVKNAQEAHEAIRPSNPSIIPANIKQYLTDDEYKLYDLIWKRLVASQMNNAILDQVNITVETSRHVFRATGSSIKFDGFLVLYNESDEDAKKEEDKILPVVREKEELKLKKIVDKQHFTEPPAHFSEASLVKKMEEIGIGRPSTYAAIISILQERGYVKLEKKKFMPENRGIVVNAFLKLYFLNYVEYNYTAKLEDDLDVISNGKKNWKNFLREFWSPFKGETDKALLIKNSDVLTNINEVLGKMIFGYDENGQLKNHCPDCENGLLSIRAGKFGIFIACSNYPACKHTERIIEGGNDNEEKSETNVEKFETKTLGQLDGKNIYLKRGPYGFYAQQGEDDPKQKPKRISLKNTQNPENTALDDMAFLFSLPRTVGKHPDDGGDVKINIGPYGPYVMWNKKFFSIKGCELQDVDLEKALEIIGDGNKKEKPRGQAGGKKFSKKKKK